MAETFKNQVDALTGFASTEDTALSDWLTAGAREILNFLPGNLKEKCTTLTTIEGSPDTLDNIDTKGDIIAVTRLDADSGGTLQPCRKIPVWAHSRATDSNDLVYYGTVSDPVYYIYYNSLRLAPPPTDNQYAYVHHINIPTVAHGDTTISNFPDEVEYLVTIYASIKALQRLMNNMLTNTDITAGLTAAKAALDQAEAACNKFEAADTDSIFGDEDTFTTATSSITGASDALSKAQALIDEGMIGGDTEPNTAQYWLNDEDGEMVIATVEVAKTELQRAQMEIQHWKEIGDMRTKEISAALSEASGYIGEVTIRLSVDAQKYKWYVDQQDKLKYDYQNGISIITAKQVSKSKQSSSNQQLAQLMKLLKSAK